MYRMQRKKNFLKLLLTVTNNNEETAIHTICTLLINNYVIATVRYI